MDLAGLIPDPGSANGVLHIPCRNQGSSARGTSFDLAATFWERDLGHLPSMKTGSAALLENRSL